MKDNLTIKEASKLLGKSKRTITRYIKKGLLNPKKIKIDNRANEDQLLIDKDKKLKIQEVKNDTI